MPSKDIYTVLQDGQLAVATVAQTGDIIPEEGKDPTKYTTALVQTADGPQLCQKTYSVGGGGGGGETAWGDITGTLSNQTDLKTALDSKLENTATGTNSLSILGSATSQNEAINIGSSSSAGTSENVAIGTYAQTSGDNISASGATGASTTAVGFRATASTGTAIGSCTDATKGVAIGRGRSTTNKVTASAEGSIAIGTVDSAGTYCKATKKNAIQLGSGTNATADTFQVYSYPMLDGTTGKIPADRIPDTLLKNTATGNNSLTILGTATGGTSCVNIGINSKAAANSHNTSVGYNAKASGSGCLAVGSNASTNGDGSTAIGSYAKADGESSSTSYMIAIGYYTRASADGAIVIGQGVWSQALEASAQDAIQIGRGSSNANAKTLQIWEYQLLDGNTGKIPTDRMTKVIELTTTSVELASDNIYNGAELASVTFTLPATISANFTAQVNFTSGTTATVLTAPNTVYFDGDDCAGGVFTPAASKRYQVLITNDGVTTLGYVLSH